jgi:hypothetical protein
MQVTPLRQVFPLAIVQGTLPVAEGDYRLGPLGVAAAQLIGRPEEQRDLAQQQIRPQTLVPRTGTTLPGLLPL